MGRMTEAIKHLLIINVLFFIAAQLLSDEFYYSMALWFPKNENFGVWQFVTHMFMHDKRTIFHILFNMYALWAFGSPLEQIWGKSKFLFFYFSAGLGAAFIHTLVNYFYFTEGYEALLGAGYTPERIANLLPSIPPGQYLQVAGIPEKVMQNFAMAYNIPAVGASGAVYGILVAFGMMFPNAELMLIFLPIPVKAKYFIPILIALDLFSGVTGMSIFGSGIAHFAHIGGALFGFIMMWYWKRNQFKNNRWDQ